MKFGSITTPIITDGLVFHVDAANRASYPRSTTAVLNDTINSNGGTANSSPTFTNDAFDFDGTDDYFQYSVTPNDLVGSSFSIGAWINTDVSTQGMIISNTNASRFYIETYLRSGNLYCHWGIGSSQNSATSAAQISTDTWHYYIATYDGNIATGFLNGVLKDTTTIGAKSYGSNNLRIGYHLNSLAFNGEIGPVHIYNRALSSTEVLHNYNALKGRFGL
tara:strand:+ start:904 stop:1563 length:660 start_codon:yes stop_codon:yes gene_type:complete